MDADLLRYVKQALRKGHSEERIRHTLRQQGWDAESINTALERAKAERGSGGVILASLLLVIVGVGGALAWFFIIDAESPSDPNPDPDRNTSLDDPQPPSNETPVRKESNASTSSNASEELVSSCELEESNQEKFLCYKEDLRGNLTSVDCRALSQPDRRLCTQAYEQLVLA